MKRKVSIRRKVSGTAERPRLTVFRSNKHIYAQVVNDEENLVITSASTVSKTDQSELTGKSKKEKAKLVGTRIAEACKAKGVQQVVFDRNGYRYHGRVQSLAGAAREGGLNF